MLSRRTALRWWSALPLAGCAGLGSSNAITIGEDELQRLVERRFPIDRRALEVFDVELASPVVRLLPASNRLAATLALAASDRVFGSRWRGRLGFESALRFEPADQTLRLVRVRVTDFGLEGPGARGSAERLGAVLAENVLEDFVVYRLPPERAQQLRMAALAPGPVTIGPRGIEISLQPGSR